MPALRDPVAYFEANYIPEPNSGCDVRSCVNPDHLFLGTKKDNSDDMMAKGRHAPVSFPGELNGQAKLTVSDVAEIQRRSNENWKALAKEFGVHHQTIWKIRRGLRWRGDR